MPSVRILFTGDLLLDRGVRKHIEKKGAVSLFKETSSTFQKADFVVANLECPVTKRINRIYKRFIFRAEPEWLKHVNAAGITHLVFSNNHIYDQGRLGIKDSYDAVIKNKMQAVGFGTDQRQACSPVILEKNRIRIALFSSVFLPLEGWAYLPDSLGMCQATADELAENIKNFKRKEPATRIVVILHWGIEYMPEPYALQRQQAQTMIDAGADAIIGHHPHVIQKMRTYKEKPIFYSLGNFIFDQQTEQTTEGLVAEIVFTESTQSFRGLPIKIKNCVPYFK